MSTPELNAALAAVQQELPRIQKAETAHVASQKGSYSYSYAGLADISEKVLPLLGKHGLAFLALATLDAQGRYVLSCELVHTSGEQRESVYLLPTGGSPQALGSAITYGRRYMLCAMTGVAPDEDDDGAAAEAAAAEQPKTAQRKPAAERNQTSRRTAKQQTSKPTTDEPAEHPISAQQLKKLHTMLSNAGITEREDGLAILSKLINRQIESSKHLTRTEADTTITNIEDADDPAVFLADVLATVETGRAHTDEPRHETEHDDALWEDDAARADAAAEAAQ